MKTLSYPLALIIAIGLALSAQTSVEAEITPDNWSSIGSTAGIGGANFDTRVNDMAVDASGNIYVTGMFRWIADAQAGWVVKWDGTEWTSLGTDYLTSGLNIGYELEVYANEVYARGAYRDTGGPVSTIKDVIKWDGTQWITIGTATGSRINVMHAHAGKLYVGGLFTEIGGIAANNIAAWNGSTWETVGTGTDNEVTHLETLGGDLYTMGSFANAGGVAANRFAVWDGALWAAGPNGMDASIVISTLSATTIHDSQLVIGGAFTLGASPDTENFATWDGNTWTALTANTQVVYALQSWNNELYASARFRDDANQFTHFIARWDGAAWATMGSGLAGDLPQANAMEGTSDTLFIGGLMDGAGDVHSEGIVTWDGAAWGALPLSLGAPPPGPNEEVLAIARHGNDILIGGIFTSVGGLDAMGIARWDGFEWSAMGPALTWVDGPDYEIDGNVRVIEVVGEDIYIGGRFNRIGGVEVNGVAKWNGSGWDALGAGITPGPLSSFIEINAMHYADGILYVSGNFDEAGGVSARNTAMWDGNNWLPMQGGLDGPAYAIAKYDGDVYFAGSFNRAFNASTSPWVYRFVKWDGAQWVDDTGGNIGTPAVMKVWDGKLYVAGDYFNWFQPGQSQLTNVYAWNGSAFSAVGTEFKKLCRSIEFIDGNIYIGDDTGTLSMWDGASWTQPAAVVADGNTKAPVNALLATGNQLFMGGKYGIVEGKVSPCLARAFIDGVPPLEIGNGKATVFFDVPAGQYLIQRASGDVGTWELLATRTAGTSGGITFHDPELADSSATFYRAVPVNQ